MDLQERADGLSKAIERLEQQKIAALKEVEHLTRQITANLVDGKDPAELLIARHFKRELAEAIDPAIEEARKQLQPVQRDIKAVADKQNLERLQEELAPKQQRLDEIEKKMNTCWGPTREQELMPLLEEQQRLTIAVRMLGQQINELQSPVPEMHDNPGALDRMPPAWMKS